MLWYIQGTALSLTPAVNALIKSVILQVCDLVHNFLHVWFIPYYCRIDTCTSTFQERGGASAEFTHENLMLKFKMDNEFELVYVVRERLVLWPRPQFDIQRERGFGNVAYSEFCRGL